MISTVRGSLKGGQRAVQSQPCASQGQGQSDPAGTPFLASNGLDSFNVNVDHNLFYSLSFFRLSLTWSVEEEASA